MNSSSSNPVPLIPRSGNTSRFRYLAGGAVLAAGVVGTIVFWGQRPGPPSKLNQAPQLSQLPGQAATDETLKRLAVEDATNRAREASRQRDSYIASLNTSDNFPRSPQMPAPVAPVTPAQPTTTFAMPSAAPRPSPTPSTAAKESGPPDQEVGKYAALYGILAANMAPKASAMLMEQTPEFLAKKREDLRKEQEARIANGGGVTNASATARGGAADGLQPSVIMPALRWAMGQTVLATDTDGAGGLVVVDITSGPLTGARLRGAAQRREERMGVSLTEMSWQGRAVPVDAVLISPETKETAVASSVDHHYAARLLFPSLAAIASGAGQAIALSGSTQIASPYGSSSSYRNFSPEQIATIGVGAAGNNLQQVLNDMAPKGPTIHLDAGVPVGVMFLKDVTTGP